MSRRITFIALATSATLIATHAAADRECFEDSCRSEQAVEAEAAQQTQAAPLQKQKAPEPVASAADKPSNTVPDAVAPEPVAAAAANADAGANAAKAKAETKPEPKVEEKTETKTEAKTEVKTGTKPEPVVVVAKPELVTAPPVAVVKPEPVSPPPQVAAKPEPRVEPKPEIASTPATTTTLRPYTPPPAPVMVRSEPDVALPSVTSEPAPHRAVQSVAQPQQPQRYEDLRPRREPKVRIIPQVAERPQLPVAAPAPARPARSVPPALASVERAPIAVPPPPRPTRIEVEPYGPPPRPVAVDVPRQAPSVASAAVIEVPGEVQTGDGLVTVYPNLRPDPAWKLCQIDSRDLGRRAYRCTAYSYHPYGEGGYRPYGTYRNYPSAPGYVTAPNAKIIRIEQY